MEQESISKKTTAIIGAGPAGCICAKFLQNEGMNVTIFEKNKPLYTILPTGGGRCNLANAQYDYKELASNYPRGEKFLYSIFSKFSTQDTIDFFKSIGVETYTQDDFRIFPTSNCSKTVRTKLLNSIKNVGIVNEEVKKIQKINNAYKIKTNNAQYLFDNIVIAIGGHSATNLIKDLEIDITPQTQSLVGLTTEQNLSKLSGVKVTNIEITTENKKFTGDILFTHKGVSGPIIYEISSVYARKDFPYKIEIKFAEIKDFQKYLNINSNKIIANLLKQYIPKAIANYILENLDIDTDTKCTYINKIKRDAIQNQIENFVLSVNGKVPNGEVVTCGGVSLNEINPKTLESKKYPNLYFCGEILDIDGFCGGFNLQACWSTGFVAAKSIIYKETGK